VKLPGILFTLLFSLLAWGQTPKLPPRPQRLKIALDPGHGGEDAGAKGPKKLLEKQAALGLAQILATTLEAAGFEVMLTRSDDTFLPLWERAQKANEAEADLFISLHLNAARARGARGSEVYFLSLDQGDADASELAALENSGGDRAPEPQDIVAGILDNLAQEAFLHDSERLAVAIQTQLNLVGNIKQRGVKQAPFAVLRRAAMPAALVEASFISNPKEEAKLRDPAFQKKIAEAITRGVRQFFAAGTVTAKRKAILGPR